jgi:hypothetical protein
MKIAWNHFITVATITSISIVVFAMLAPYVDEGRQEARTGMANSAVRMLRDEFVGEAPREPTELEERDPWGNAYIVQAANDGQIRVTSAGPDGVFDSFVTGSDDIWSGMPASPMEPFHSGRRWECARAFAVAFGVWIAFMLCYWRSVRGADRCQSSPTTL